MAERQIMSHLNGDMQKELFVTWDGTAFRINWLGGYTSFSARGSGGCSFELEKPDSAAAFEVIYVNADLKTYLRPQNSVPLLIQSVTSYTCLAAGATITEFSTDGTLADNSDAALPTEKAVKTYGATIAPLTGFENRTDSTLGMSGSDFQATTAGTYYIWTGGTRRSFNSTQQVAISTDKTLHYVYFNGATLTASTTPWDITGNNAPVAVVYKDGSNYWIGDERHSYLRNKQWHLWAHDTIGARYESGLTGTFDATTLSITQGVVFDEDIEFDTGGTKTDCALWYRDTGGAAMRVELGVSTPYKITAGAIKYDASGTLTSVDTSKYVNSWVYASPCSAYPIQVVVGQAQHSTLNAARSEALPTIPLVTAEWKLLYRVTYQNSGGSPAYVEKQDYRQVSTGPATTGTVSDHAALINRDAANQHPWAAINLVDATACTDPADGDMAALYDLSGTANKSATLAYLKTYFQTAIPLVNLDINGGTADTDPDDADLAAIYSGDATANRKITLANLKTYFQSGAGGAVTFNEPAADNSAGTQAIFDSATVGESVAFPDLLYLKSDGKWWKADADASTTMPGLRMALETKSADATCSMLVAGRVRDDDWNWTVGGIIYASTTGGALTQTAPTGTGDIVQQVGIAYHADKMIFAPDMTQLEIV